MKAFVTGSTGLLGSNLVQLLLAQGFEVKALARSRQKAEQVLGKESHAQIVVGDMESIDGFASELTGCDVVFHTAAYFRESFARGDHWPALKKINVEATICLLNEAEKAGVKKMIYVSSGTVIGTAPNGQPSNESTPPNPNADANLYRKSKIMAEQSIADWLKTHRMPIVLILPSVMIGPMDAAPTAMGQTIINLLNQTVPAIPPGGASFVDARDVAQAMINAIDAGKSGERYIINQDYHSLAELAQAVEKVSGIPGPRRRVPFPIMLAVVWTQEQIAALRGKSALITVTGLRASNQHHLLTAQKAMRDLKITFRSFGDSVRDEVQWYTDHKYIKVAQK